MKFDLTAQGHDGQFTIICQRPGLSGRLSLNWDSVLNHHFTAAVIATDHDSIDYESLRNTVSLVVDTRNVYARQSLFGDNIVKV
jgi:UDP-N-acetyl-D-glucosamine dehydrogenase